MAQEASEPSDSAGWIPGVSARRSPHFDRRPAGVVVGLLVLHFISLPAGCFEGERVDELFMGTLDAEAAGLPELKGLRVSSHFFVRRSGEVRQYVNVFDRAWHAGLSNFRGRNACNDFSVGIELEGTDAAPFTDEQYDALRDLIPKIRSLVPLAAATGHEFIAPGRKIDPGPFFDWPRLAAMLPDGMALAISAADCDREMLAERARAMKIAG